MLTTREFQILEKLLLTKNTIRIKDVSDEFSVSVRTIKNDLENVKGWLKEQGVEFHAQPNKGIWIECMEDERIFLSSRMVQVGKEGLHLDQSMRVQRIIGYLLLQPNYVTAQSLADVFDVSRNTILSDLNKVEEYIEPWFVKLERKQRSGYLLGGDEKHVRFLYEHLIKEQLSNNEIYQIIMSLVSNDEHEAFELSMPKELLISFDIISKPLRHKLQMNINTFSQSELITLVVRLMVSLTRLNLGFSLGSYRLLNKGKYETHEMNFLLPVMENIFKKTELAFLESEFTYISGGMYEEIQTLDIPKVTREIILYVSDKEKVNYESDLKLFSNLVAHLTLRLQSGTAYLTEINPFTEEIHKNHTSLVLAIKEACQVHMGKEVMLAQPSFYAFIALHFLVSYENKVSDQKKKAKALYVCSTGHGVARLIKNKVEREISDIHLFAYCSIIEVDELCKKEQIDLIISVFPIEADIPVIVVNPIPTKNDLNTIKKEVESIIHSENRPVNELEVQNLNNENQQKSEVISQEIIIKGYELFQEITMEFFIEENQQNLKNALMIHIFLMVHRYYFRKQYDYFAYSTENLSEKDERTKQRLMMILEKKELLLNDAEVVALLQYFK